MPEPRFPEKRGCSMKGEAIQIKQDFQSTWKKLGRRPSDFWLRFSDEVAGHPLVAELLVYLSRAAELKGNTIAGYERAFRTLAAAGTDPAGYEKAKGVRRLVYRQAWQAALRVKIALLLEDMPGEAFGDSWQESWRPDAADVEALEMLVTECRLYPATGVASSAVGIRLRQRMEERAFEIEAGVREAPPLPPEWSADRPYLRRLYGDAVRPQPDLPVHELTDDQKVEEILGHLSASLVRIRGIGRERFESMLELGRGVPVAKRRSAMLTKDQRSAVSLAVAVDTWGSLLRALPDRPDAGDGLDGLREAYEASYSNLEVVREGIGTQIWRLYTEQIKDQVVRPSSRSLRLERLPKPLRENRPSRHRFSLGRAIQKLPTAVGSEPPRVAADLKRRPAEMRRLVQREKQLFRAFESSVSDNALYALTREEARDRVSPEALRAAIRTMLEDGMDPLPELRAYSYVPPSGSWPHLPSRKSTGRTIRTKKKAGAIGEAGDRVWDALAADLQGSQHEIAVIAAMIAGIRPVEASSGVIIRRSRDPDLAATHIEIELLRPAKTRDATALLPATGRPMRCCGWDTRGLGQAGKLLLELTALGEVRTVEASADTIKAAMQAAARRAGFRAFDVRSFRHALSARLKREGWDPGVISWALGHVNERMQERYGEPRSKWSSSGLAYVVAGDQILGRNDRVAGNIVNTEQIIERIQTAKERAAYRQSERRARVQKLRSNGTEAGHSNPVVRGRTLADPESGPPAPS